MPTTPYSDADYKRDFIDPSAVNASALERALDIRKFEIDLYWKRATYFWTFIGATLAGFVAIQTTSNSSSKTDMSMLLANLGIVFSFAWYCANRGSKYWQENWEFHVDMLEDKINGPLYKVVMSRARPASIREKIIDVVTGPAAISVSKVNQLISLFMTLMWIGLLIYALPEFRLSAPINLYYSSVIGLSAATCISFLFLGRTYSGGYWHRANRRTSSINNDAYVSSHSTVAQAELGAKK